MLHDIEFSIWAAFWELSTERQIGMGTGPIPVSKIYEHAPRVGMSINPFKRIIRSMDDEYLSHLSRKQSEQQK